MDREADLLQRLEKSWKLLEYVEAQLQEIRGVLFDSKSDVTLVRVGYQLCDLEQQVCQLMAVIDGVPSVERPQPEDKPT